MRVKQEDDTSAARRADGDDRIASVVFGGESVGDSRIIRRMTKSRASPFRTGTSGPFRTIKQTFVIKEPIPCGN